MNYTSAFILYTLMGYISQFTLYTPLGYVARGFFQKNKETPSTKVDKDISICVI